VSILHRLVPAVAIALAGTFFGIAAYVNLVEHLARLNLAAGALLAQWKISYAAGIAIQLPLVIITWAVCLLAWWLTRDWRWIVGGLLMLANWPWTLAFIAPVNSALNGTAPEAAGPATMQLIERWGQFHAVRTAFGGCALLVFVWAMSRGRGAEARST